MVPAGGDRLFALKTDRTVVKIMDIELGSIRKTYKGIQKPPIRGLVSSETLTEKGKAAAELRLGALNLCWG